MDILWEGEMELSYNLFILPSYLKPSPAPDARVNSRNLWPVSSDSEQSGVVAASAAVPEGFKPRRLYGGVAAQ